MITNQYEKDLLVLKALEYLVQNHHGYIEDLTKNACFDDKRIREFCSVGFMKTGWTDKKQTWGVLPFAIEYLAIVR